MKTTILLICAISLLGCEPKPNTKEMITPGTGIGGVNIGMTEDQVVARLGPPNQTTGPDRNGNSALSFPGGFSAIRDSNSTVIAIQCGMSFTGRTKEGIGIGSTKSEITRSFGAPEKTEASSDGSSTIYYIQRGLKMKLGADEKAQHITIRPKGAA